MKKANDLIIKYSNFRGNLKNVYSVEIHAMSLSTVGIIVHSNISIVRLYNGRIKYYYYHCIVSNYQQ